MLSFSINSRVMSIKGDNTEINRFIDEFKPFIASCAEKLTGRYVRFGSDDESSIAMLAFKEAIDTYEDKKGHFLPFAQNIIKRRLIDYLRKEQKNRKGIFIVANDFEGDDDGSADDDNILDKVSWDNYHEEVISEYRRIEIDLLGKELKEWRISLDDLVKVSPKHEATRKVCRDAIRYMLMRSDLLERLRRKKTLPIAEICNELHIHRKILERSRKYIISAILIKTGDYEHLSSFVSL